MRLFVIPAVLACACAAGAQSASPRVIEARPEPAEALDNAILGRTLYGSVGAEELTTKQTQSMVDAAVRIFERRQARVERVKQLVDQGAAPRLSLTPFIEDLDRSRRTLEMARSRAALFQEVAEMARVETAALESPVAASYFAEKYAGSGRVRTADLKTLGDGFEKQFGRPLPLSAQGATAFHRSLGYDHRGRADVAINPDDCEGVWLRAYLQALRIPYIAFRGAVPGRASGAHVHIGPPSERLKAHGG